MLDWSPTALFVKRLVESIGREGAHRAVNTLVASFTNVELAAFAAHWPSWARSKQLPPAGEWRSWGFLTARGFGKTEAIAQWLTTEVQEGRALRIGFAAQNEIKSIEVHIETLVKVAPPWFKPHWEVSSLTLTWPNGVTGRVFTPEVPGAIRSENLTHAWLSEIQSWPRATLDETYSNFLFATRIGDARTVWDATPKRGHPLLKKLMKRAEDEPARHRIVRGTMYENVALPKSVIQDLEREFGGTQKGREELLGEMLPESENALFKQTWIDDRKRGLPDKLVLRVLGIDPAITARSGSDRTGIVECGRGVDGQGYVLADYSGKHSPGAWASLVLEKYVQHACDLIVVETNKGGDMVTQILRGAAGNVGLHIVVIGKDEPVPPRIAGTVFVREFYSRGPKEDRAQPLATAYEKGRVSHVVGAALSDLEETMTTWEPAPGHRSPDGMDALVHAMREVLGLAENKGDPKASFTGITEIARALTSSASPIVTVSNLSAMLSRGGGGRI